MIEKGRFKQNCIVCGRPCVSFLALAK